MTSKNFRNVFLTVIVLACMALFSACDLEIQGPLDVRGVGDACKADSACLDARTICVIDGSMKDEAGNSVGTCKVGCVVKSGADSCTRWNDDYACGADNFCHAGGTVPIADGGVVTDGGMLDGGVADGGVAPAPKYEVKVYYKWTKLASYFRQVRPDGGTPTSANFFGQAFWAERGPESNSVFTSEGGGEYVYYVLKGAYIKPDGQVNSTGLSTLPPWAYLDVTIGRNLFFVGEMTDGGVTHPRLPDDAWVSGNATPARVTVTYGTQTWHWDFENPVSPNYVAPETPVSCPFFTYVQNQGWRVNFSQRVQ